MQVIKSCQTNETTKTATNAYNCRPVAVGESCVPDWVHQLHPVLVRRRPEDDRRVVVDVVVLATQTKYM